LHLGSHDFKVLFQCAFIELLAREAKLVQDSADMIAVMLEIELTTDERSDPEGRPTGIWKAVDLRTLDKETLE
jgi:hypothetical protein